MPRLYLLPLAKISSVELSPDLVALQQLEKLSVPISPTLVSDQILFVDICDHNGLIQRHTVESVAQIGKLLPKVRIPKEISTQFHQAYHQQLDGGYVRLAIWTRYGQSSWKSEVKGDANILDSLKEAWQEAFELALQHGEQPFAALASCRLVLQSQLAAPVAHGNLFTKHPSTSEKHISILQLWPGATCAASQRQTPLHWAIDIRTGGIVQHASSQFHQKGVRQLDRVELKATAERLELNTTHLLKIINAIAAFKRLHSSNYLVELELIERSYQVTWVCQLSDATDTAQVRPTTRTQVLLSTGSAGRIDLTHPDADGIGLLRSEYMYQQLTAHPDWLIKKGKGDSIKQQCATVFAAVNRNFPAERVLYRLQNFTTSELTGFGHGTEMERMEPNPYLGWRGALRLLDNPSAFEPELKAFQQWLSRRRAPTGLIVPFVRSASEWQWILQEWQRREFFSEVHFEAWFQITTPENVFHLESYLLPLVTGVSLNLRTVVALLAGIDPDEAQLLASYPSQLELQLLMLEEIARRRDVWQASHPHQELLFYLHLESFSYEVVRRAVLLGFDGVVIHPEAVRICRNCVLETEQDQRRLLSEATV